jgi:palmitoyltransferase
VGHGNQSHFIWFLAFAVAGCAHGAVILTCSLYAGIYRDYYIYNQQYSKATVKLTTWSLIFTVFNIGLSVGVVIAVGMLLFFQLRSVFSNRTGIESWIIDKAIYRRRAMTAAAKNAGNADFQAEPFVYPYDLGWKQNAKEVLNFSCMPIGDGVNWNVVEGCDQYTLTVCFKLS